MRNINLGIQIVEDTQERMVVRVSPLMAYIQSAVMLGASCMILYITFGLARPHDVDIIAYLPLLYIPFFLAVGLLQFRKINVAVIDRRRGVVMIKCMLPLLILRKPVCYPLGMVEELRYLGTVLRQRAVPLFVFSDGKVLPFQEGGGRRYRLSEDALLRHQRIAEYLGVPYSSQ